MYAEFFFMENVKIYTGLLWVITAPQLLQKNTNIQTQNTSSETIVCSWQRSSPLATFAKRDLKPLAIDDEPKTYFRSLLTWTP